MSPIDHLISAFQVLRLQRGFTASGFGKGAGDLNSGLHTFTTSHPYLLKIESLCLQVSDAHVSAPPSGVLLVKKSRLTQSEVTMVSVVCKNLVDPGALASLTLSKAGLCVCFLVLPRFLAKGTMSGVSLRKAIMSQDVLCPEHLGVGIGDSKSGHSLPRL